MELLTEYFELFNVEFAEASSCYLRFNDNMFKLITVLFINLCINNMLKILNQILNIFWVSLKNFDVVDNMSKKFHRL